jgi:hypothetical protein
VALDAYAQPERLQNRPSAPPTLCNGNGCASPAPYYYGLPYGPYAYFGPTFYPFYFGPTFYFGGFGFHRWR